MKKLQTLVAFTGYEQIFRNESMTTIQQAACMEKLYHGDGAIDTVSLSQQAVQGLSLFRGLYYEQVPVVTGGLSASTGSDKVQLELKQVLHCSNKRIVVAGAGGINRAVIASSTMQNRVNLTGRKLLTFSQTAMRNCRKALSVVTHHDSPYKDCIKSGNLPSGCASC